MNKIRHASLEQPSPPPERLPRLVPLLGVSTTDSPSRQQTSECPNNVPPQFPPGFGAHSISQDSTTMETTRIRRPSELDAASVSPPQISSRGIYMPPDYNCNNTYTGTARDARRSWNTNLPSVISGVAVDSFDNDQQPSRDDLEKHKKYNLKEFRQRRRDRRSSRNSVFESDTNPVSLIFLTFLRFIIILSGNFIMWEKST